MASLLFPRGESHTDILRKLKHEFLECASLTCKQKDFACELRKCKFIKKGGFRDHSFFNSDNSNCDQMMCFDDCMNACRDMCKWSDDDCAKHREWMKECFNVCRCSKVKSDEFWKRVGCCKFFAPCECSNTTTHCPKRNHRCLLLCSSVCLANPACPEWMTWEQVDKFFHAWHVWSSFVLKVDDLFFESQKKMFDELPKCDREDLTDAMRDTRIFSMEVPKGRFIRKFMKHTDFKRGNESKKCHAFWCTKQGHEWIKIIDDLENCKVENKCDENKCNENKCNEPCDGNIQNPDPQCPFKWCDIFEALKCVEPCVQRDCECDKEDCDNKNDNDCDNENKACAAAPAAMPGASVSNIVSEIESEVAAVQAKVESTTLSQIDRIRAKYRSVVNPSAAINPANATTINANMNKVNAVVQKNGTEIVNALNSAGNTQDAAIVTTILGGIQAVETEAKTLVAPVIQIVNSVEEKLAALMPGAKMPVMNDHATAFLASIPTVPTFSLAGHRKQYRHNLTANAK